MTTCATITFDTAASPKTLTIDFGTTDCLCGDGNYRRGKILVSWTGPYRDSGSVRTITFDQYFVNYNQLQGTKTVTNNGTNGSGHPTFTVTVNGSVTWDANISEAVAPALILLPAPANGSQNTIHLPGRMMSY